MTRKLTYEEVSIRFEEKGFKLTSSFYENSRQKLDFVCKCGRMSKTTLSALRVIEGCKECTNYKKTKTKKRLSYDDVKELFEVNNCKLLSSEYINNATPLDYICECGNTSRITYANFRKGQRCKECAKDKVKSKQRLSYEEVKTYFEKEGCKLLEKEYKNNATKMKYMCNCGEVSFISFGKFQSGRRCYNCGRKKVNNSRRSTYDDVRSVFEDSGYILLEDEYLNAKTPMRCRCSCGNETEITYDVVKQGQKGCNHCYKETIGEKQRLDYTFVKNYFKERGCELLEPTYKNGSQKLRYVCECGRESVIRFNNFRKGAKCLDCAIENATGEKSPRYRHDLTKQEREKKRLILGESIVKWRISVFERDNYTCQSCGVRNKELRAHHLDGYHWAKDKRIDVDNGVTLCYRCHDIKYKGSFHNTYGTNNNTRQQFEEWIENRN